MKVRIPNSGGQGNMNQMLMKAQKMQEDMQTLQGDLENREYTATSGGGAVNVTVDGKYMIKSLKINPDIIDADDAEMIEDLVTVAVNEAIKTASETAESEMSAITGGLNIPGLL